MLTQPAGFENNFKRQFKHVGHLSLRETQCAPLAQLGWEGGCQEGRVFPTRTLPARKPPASVCGSLNAAI